MHRSRYFFSFLSVLVHHYITDIVCSKRFFILFCPFYISHGVQHYIPRLWESVMLLVNIIGNNIYSFRDCHRQDWNEYILQFSSFLPLLLKEFFFSM